MSLQSQQTATVSCQHHFHYHVQIPSSQTPSSHLQISQSQLDQLTRKTTPAIPQRVTNHHAHPAAPQRALPPPQATKPQTAKPQATQPHTVQIAPATRHQPVAAVDPQPPRKRQRLQLPQPQPQPQIQNQQSSKQPSTSSSPAFSRTRSCGDPRQTGNFPDNALVDRLQKVKRRAGAVGGLSTLYEHIAGDQSEREQDWNRRGRCVGFNHSVYKRRACDCGRCIFSYVTVVEERDVRMDLFFSSQHDVWSCFLHCKTPEGAFYVPVEWRPKLDRAFDASTGESCDAANLSKYFKVGGATRRDRTAAREGAVSQDPFLQ